jgi:HlyD family secretion protein
MTRGRKMLLLGLGIAAAAGAWILIQPTIGGAEAAPRVIEETPSVVAPGLVEGESETIELAFEHSGRLDAVLVDEGARVEKGQVLARLDDRLARARVDAAQAALEGARARRDLAFRGSRQDEVRAARAEADAARAQAVERADARDRAARLRKDEADAIAEADVDASRHLASAAEAQAAAADARYQLVKDGPRAELRREAMAQVAAAEAELEQARTVLDQTELRAPRDGVVLRRFVEVGEQVQTTPLTIAMTMADTRSLRIRAEIDEADLAHVTVGQKGWATADAYGDRRFPGYVVRVSGELGRKKVRDDDPRARIDTRVLEVLFVLDEATELPLGLRMDVHLSR